MVQWLLAIPNIASLLHRVRQTTSTLDTICHTQILPLEALIDVGDSNSLEVLQQVDPQFVDASLGLAIGVVKGWV